MISQFCPTIAALPPQFVYGHFLSASNPFLLLVYVLAAHDIQLDHEKMARLSRQQLDARLWLTSAEHAAAGMSYYVNYAQHLRQILESGVQKNPYEYLQRQGCDISNLPTPPPIIESSPERGAAPGPDPNNQGYFAGTEYFVGYNYHAMWPPSGECPWYNPHMNNWVTNTINYWIPTNDNVQLIALHQPTPMELPNDPLGIVESIERDDSAELPTRGPAIVSSENSRAQCLSSPEQHAYTYHQDPVNLSARTQFRLGHLDQSRSWEKGELAWF